VGFCQSAENSWFCRITATFDALHGVHFDDLGTWFDTRYGVKHRHISNIVLRFVV
jgi:hypothetical protein